MKIDRYIEWCPEEEFQSFYSSNDRLCVPFIMIFRFKSCKTNGGGTPDQFLDPLFNEIELCIACGKSRWESPTICAQRDSMGIETE